MAVGTGAGEHRRARVCATLLHAPVVAVLGVLLSLAATAQQPPVLAPEVTMVTNFGQPVIHHRARTLNEVTPVLAQEFTTGGDRGRFEATRIGFKVATVNEVDGFDVTASLHEANATGRPGMEIAELVGPSSIVQQSRNYWEVPDGITLEPDTSYVVVLRCDVGGTAAEICDGDEHIRIRAVLDDDEDDVVHGVDEGLFNGWSIANDGLGGTWGGLTIGDASHAIEVKGYSARIPYIVDDGVTVTSTPANGGDTYWYGETIEISVQFSRTMLVVFEPVVIENSLGIQITQDRPLYPDLAPSFRFSLGDPGAAQDRYAYYAGGNYTNTLKFQYIVTSGDKDSDGIDIPRGDDAFGHNLPDAFKGDTTRLRANLEFSELGIQTDHKVNSTPKIDTVNPSESVRITSVPATGTTYRNREVVEVTVTFDQPVLVTPPVLASIGIDGGSGGRWRGAKYSHGSGTESVAFHYVVKPADRDTNGIDIYPNLLAQGGDPHHVDGVQGSGNIVSLRGNLAVRLASASVSHDPNHKVDGSMVTPHVEVSPAALEVDEGDSAGASYRVWLTQEPSGPVTVTVGGYSDTDVLVDSASLTFTTTDWSTKQTVTVTAGQDDDAADDEVTLTHAVAGGGYDSAAASDVIVTVRDNDTQGVTASRMSLTVPEGGTAEYTVVLDAEPSEDVTVTVAGASGDVSIDGAIDGDRVLTFTSVDWNVPQTVTVRAAEDDDAVADGLVTLTNALAGGGSATVTVTVTENDTTSVSVAPTDLRVNEGSTGVYTVVLTAQPTGDVTVTVSGASGDVTVDKTTLTFTAVTWETEQTVTVTAGQDADAVNDTVTLTHSVSGGGYGSVVVSDVEVTVEDDERGVTVSETELTVTEGDTTGSSYTVVLAAEPTGDVTVTVGGHTGTDVTVDETTLTFTTTTWETEQTVTVTAGDDSDALNDTVTLTHSVSGGGYDGVDVAGVVVTVEDDDRRVVVSETELTVTEGDTTGSSYTVVLGGQPSGPVTVTVGGHSGTDVTVSRQTLTFTTTTWETEQTVTVTAGQDVDALNDTVTLTHTVSGGGYDGVEAGSVEVTVEDADRGVTVSETELTVTEGDTTGSSYTVVLAAEPSGDVTVTVGGHASTDVTVSRQTLTFTTTTWETEQTVTVTAGQDADAVNDTVTLTHSVSGGGYDGVEAGSVEVTVEDTDRGVTVSETELTVTEGDATGSSYTVVLASEPSGDVTVTVGGHASTDVTVSRQTLTFTTTTWETEQTVTVTAGADIDAVNDTVTLTHTVSGGGYDGVDAASVVVTVEDADRGVVVSETELTVTEGDTTGSSYTVVLASEPTGDVTVTVGGHASTDVTVSRQTLTFTTSMWETEQTVTVTAGQDADAVNDTVTLTHTVSGGGYDGVEAGSVEVTVEDDERGVTVSETELTVTEGDTTGSSYTVVLAAEPTGDVTVTVGGHTGTDVTVDETTLTFTTTTWETEQTVTVTAGQDVDALNDTVTLTHTVSGGGYDGVEAGSVEVTVEDTDRGVTVSETELTVTEGDTTGSSYTVVLAAEPMGDVTVTVGGHASTDVTVSRQTLTFTTSTWETEQTVTVTAGQDVDAVNDTVTLTHTVSGGGYDGVEAGSVEVTVEDTDRGVTVSETELTVTEGDTTGSSYTVVLAAEPSGDVTVTVGGHSGTDVTVSRQILTFTTTTWETEQTVTVTGGDDTDAVNDTVTLTHTVSGGGYDGVEAGSVEVTVEDTDRGVTVSETELTVTEGDTTGSSYTVVLAAEPMGDVTVTVGGHSGTDVAVSRQILTFTTTTWETEQTVTVTAGADIDAVNDTVTLTHTVSGGGYDGVEAGSVEVTVEDTDRGVTVSETELTVTEGDTTGSSYTVVLAAEPMGDVTVTVGGHASTDVTVSRQTLTFTTTTWETEQTVTVTGGQDVDAVNDTVTLTHTVSGGGYDGVEAGSVEVTVEDADRGVTVSETELTVTEGDTTGSSYTVVLAAEPSGDVTVTVGGHSGTDVAVSRQILTFTTTTWETEQTVTVTGGDDTDAVNDTVTLTHTVSGGGYDGVEAGSVEVTVEDTDRGVTVSETELTVTEGDTTGSSYTVVLAAEPMGDVTVTVGGHASTDVTVSRQTLTFTTSTWETEQTVTVTAGQDADAVNDTVTLTHTVSGGGYDGVEAGSIEVTVEDTDRGVTVSETELTVTEGDTTGSSYTVVLAAEPMGDVTVTVGGHASTDVTVSRQTLTFTTSTWETEQTVTVTAGDDPDALNDTVTLTHTVSGGGYDGVEAGSVEVTVEDTDRGVTVSETELTVTEGDTTGSSYTVVLAAEPSGDVTVTVGGHSGTDVMVSRQTLTFTTTTWETEQTVTVTAGQDVDAVNDTVTLTHTVSGGGYDGVEAGSVEVTVEDTDRGVTVSETELTVTEGDTTGSSYTVVLAAEPSGDVTVTVGGHSGTDVTVSRQILTFTTTTWETEQTVTVTAGQDVDAVNDTVTLTHTVSGGGYDGVEAGSVEVTVEDTDRGVTVGETELTVTEGDTTGSSYTVVLAAEPSGDVTVTVGGHASTDVTVSRQTLTFTTSTWETEQTVTVTAGQDVDAVNDTVTLTHEVSGGGYDGVDVADVEVTVEDTERGVTVSETELTVTEGDTTGSSYTVVLGGQPSGSVTVTVGGYTGTDVTVDETTLTFTTTTWAAEQTVTVTARQDLDAVNDTVTLTHTVSGGGYDGVDVGSVEVTVEDTERGVTVSETELTVTEGDTTGSSYTVVLGGQPSGSVTVTVGGYTGTDVTVDETTLTFTTTTWAAEQTVTVTARQDLDAVNDTVTLTHTVSGGGYDGVDVGSVEVTVADDEKETGVAEPSGAIRLCGARLDPSVEHDYEAEIDICWNVGNAIPTDSDVIIEMRSRFFWDYPGRFNKWNRVARGNDFTPCDVAAHTCMKITKSFLYRGAPETYELRIRRGRTLLATSPQLKAQAPNYNANAFEPRLSRDTDPGSNSAVARPSGPYVLKLTFAESFPDPHYWQVRRTETVPCLGTEPQCLGPQDFDLTNGTVAIKAWKEGSYKITVTPTTLGQPVIVSLPANKVKGVGEGLEDDGTNQYTRDNVASNEVATNTSVSDDQWANVPLTARFDAKPASHDGRTAFTVRIAFNWAVSTTAAAFRDHVVQVTGGEVTAVDPWRGQADVWEFTVEPHSSADVTFVVPAGRDCVGPDAVCTHDDRALSTGLAAVIVGSGAGTRALPLTARFDSMPVEHDGVAAFTFALHFSEAIRTSFKKLRDHAITVSGGTVTKAKRVDGRSDRWMITVAPDSHADVTVTLAAGRPCAETVAVCTADGKPLSNALAAVVRGPAALSVADARAREGVDAAVVFDVTLDRAAFAPVTVGYATRDGSARAGEDFTETSGTLTFAVGETVKAVVVPLLDDAKDEGEETFTLILANASGARIADTQAVGTIENDDPLQTEWIARFGRTVASQAVEAIEERLDGRGDAYVTVGGIRITGRKPTTDDADVRVDTWPDKLEPVRETRTMTGAELLLRSAFRLRTRGEDGVPRWTAWGRFARDGFRANVDGLRLSGVVTTGLLGADVSREGWLAGVALGVSEGEGPFTLTSGMESNCSRGTVESVLASVYPYARLRLTERIDVWGMAGLGDGEMTIAETGCRTIATGIGMTMGAAGARGTLLEAGKRGSPLDLDSRADVLLVRMKSKGAVADAGGFEPADARVSRVRLLLEGGRTVEIGADGSLEPTLEAGVRHDGGDAETGTGVEVGAGLRYARPGVTIQGSVRKLLTHEASGFEEWGASGSVRIHPGASDRGLSLGLTPAWGAASSGMDRLWSLPDASGLGRNEDFDAARRIDAEVGYGVGLGDGLGVVTPYTGIRLGDEGERTWRIGARWKLAPEVHLGIDAARYTREEQAPNDAVKLYVRMRW